ncbi:hypothetical protein NDU88_004444 [Pleurodeles waltl]|uniref:Uncharacterized protein n=1 Tax=Pleurodeles waltl TaxID=8319 RepID=A0AAV7UFA6_PLEWA|nr:hypothetical protein NDU88_004444 [Pleurodeles waltl]
MGLPAGGWRSEDRKGPLQFLWPSRPPHSRCRRAGRGFQIRRRRPEAAWRMVSKRGITPQTDAEDACWLKEEKSIVRLQEAEDSDKE